MSSNLIGGFFNRLEASRKYLFGSVGVLGTTNDSLIEGAFILRGQDAHPVVSVAPDADSYDFKKLNVFNDENDKKFFEAALAWDLVEEKEGGAPGRAWADGKNVSRLSQVLDLNETILTGIVLPIVQVKCYHSIIVCTFMTARERHVVQHLGVID